MDHIKIDVSYAIIPSGAAKDGSEDLPDTLLRSAAGYKLTVNGVHDILVEAKDHYEKFFPSSNSISSMSHENQQAMKDSEALVSKHEHSHMCDFQYCLRNITSNLQTLLKGADKITLYTSSNPAVMVIDKKSKTVVCSGTGAQFDAYTIDMEVESYMCSVDLCTKARSTSVPMIKNVIECAEGCLSAYNDFSQLPLALPDGWTFVARFSGIERNIPSRRALLLKKGDDYMVAIRGVYDVFEFLKFLDTSRDKFIFYGQKDPSGATAADGMYCFYENIREEIISALLQIKKIDNLYVSGHSMGAAIAEMLTLDIMNYSKFRNLLGSLKFKLVTAILAVPRAVDAAFRDMYVNLLTKYGATSIVVNNKYDIIPELPVLAWSAPLPFRYVVSFGGPFEFIDNHKIGNYIQALKKLDQ